MATKSTALDHDRLKSALKELKARIAKLPDGPALKDCLATVDELPTTLEAAYEELLDDEDRSLNFALALAIAKVVPRDPPKVVPKKLDLKFDHAHVTVYRGDLHVQGPFEFARDTVIFGDLVVDGVLRDSYEHMSLLVTGSVRAKAIQCGHKLWSGGKVEAGVVVVGRFGTVYGEDGVVADLVVVDTDEGTCVTNVKAKTFVDGEEMMMEPEKAIAKLRKVLVPACFEESDDENFDAEPLLELLAKGKPWALAKTAAKAAAKEPAKSAKPAAKKGSGARRFEYVDGTSSKFWEIRLEGKAFTTRYGKIGTDGQVTTKTFDAPAKAASEYEKLIGEKTKKGYVEKG